MVSLANVTIVVTRPTHQADKLCDLISHKGGTVLRFPVIGIAGPSDTKALDEIVGRLSEFDIAVFISPNAVDYGLKQINKRGGFPSTIKVAAVGRGSANRLAELNCSVDIFPQHQFNSEALLAMPEMQQVQHRHIVIFRGEGGREMLATSLQSRGAMVEYAECYKRIVPDIPIDELVNHWSKNQLDIFVVTSNEGLQNLYDMVGNAHRAKLLNTPLVVVSDRAVELARRLGFQSDILIADAASDQELVNAVERWRASQIIE